MASVLVRGAQWRLAGAEAPEGRSLFVGVVVFGSAIGIVVCTSVYAAGG